MKKTTRLWLMLSCVASILFYSCIKEISNNDNNSDKETQSAADNLLAESIANDVTTVTTQSEDNGVAGGSGGSSINPLLSPCATVTFDLTTMPKHLTIDYGQTNCLCLDGKYRRGKIVAAYTGLYSDSGSNHIIGFDNYYVNDFKVEGSQTVINNGHNSAGNLVFTVNTDSRIIDTAGNVLTFKSDRKRKWVEGENTLGWDQWQDDVYSITGTASGNDFSGNAYTAEIKSPLIFALDCKWIKGGKFDFKPQGELTRSIDFGDGNCDNKAVVEIAGFSFNILME